MHEHGGIEMKIGLLFWILMLLWLVFGVWMYWPAGSGTLAYGPVGGGVLLLVLVGLLGWKVFGPPLQQ
jgi:hypothetical protein